MYNDSRKGLHNICQILWNCQSEWLWVSSSAPRTFGSSFPFPEKLCSTCVWLCPLCCQVLFHDCISMIVSRFTTFTENFVICCNQITNIFCTRYGSANASSARRPCDFCPSGRSRNFGLSGSELPHCVYTNPHFSHAQALKIIHEKNWRVSLCVQELYHPRDFSLNSCSHSGMSEFNRPPLSKSCVPLIASRFTSFTKNFVIRCY